MMGKRHARSTAVQPKPATSLLNEAIKTAPRPAPAVSRPLLTRPEGGPALVGYQIITGLASLRLTVWLFALALALVFFGTLAMMDEGLYTVLNKYFRCKTFVWIPFQLFVRFCQVFFGVKKDLQVGGGFPFPGGWLIGALLLVNIVAAHAVRFRISWKRSGVLILHSGLILLMLGEFIAGEWQQEGMMIIPEGSSSNYSADYHKVELAVTDSSNPAYDEVTVVPGSMLREGNWIQNDLPFNIEVVRFLPNASSPINRRNAPAEAISLATAGDGLDVTVSSLAPVSGTGGEVDTPAAYVKLTKKDKGPGEDPGTYLVTVFLPESKQKVRVDGKDYRLSLRFARTYRPYSLHLIKFRFDKYDGTSIAKNYSSLVRIEDPERGESRETLIRMNEPLRYRGEAFYQADFDHETEKATKLQVVRNPGWLMPYIACSLVALGMLVHFGIHLVSFLLRRFAI
jgi:hypothetical protein